MRLIAAIVSLSSELLSGPSSAAPVPFRPGRALSHGRHFTPWLETRSPRRAAGWLLIAAGLTAAPVLAEPAPTLDNPPYQLVASQRTDRTNYLYTYKVRVHNAGTLAANLRASVTSAAAATRIVDGAVTFGDVAPGQSVASQDSFSFLHDRTVAFDPSRLTWTFEFDAAPAGEFSFRLTHIPETGFAGASVLIPFEVARGAGTGDIAVGLGAAPAGFSVDEVVVPTGSDDGVIVLSIERTASPGSAEFDIIASAGLVTRVAEVSLPIEPPQPAALDLIRAAMADGLLDRPTSLLYRAYAQVGDPRLPAEYRGSGGLEEDISLLREIAEVLPTLSVEFQEQLEPFVLRPANVNSWYSQRVNGLFSPPAGGLVQAALASTLLEEAETTLPTSCSDAAVSTTAGWISQRSATQPFRVWSHCSAGSTAETDLATAIQVFDLFWERVTNDMGPALPDVPAGTPINPADGLGDETIDIYLLYRGAVLRRLGQDIERIANAHGWASPWPLGASGKSSGFIAIPVTEPLSSKFLLTAIHELFHVLQFAHNVDVAAGAAIPTGLGGLDNPPRYVWWYTEASATWAEVHYERTLLQSSPLRGSRPLVYQPRFVAGFQQRPSTFALNVGRSVGVSGPRSPYDAFIWPYFLEQEHNVAMPSRQLWTAVGGVTHPNDADRRMDTVVPFESNFRKFAVRNINGEPVNNRYEVLDPQVFPKDTPPPFYQTHFRSGAPQQVEFPLTTLAAFYIRIDNDVEPAVRKAELDFTGLDSARADLGIDVDVLIKTRGGAWQAAQDYNSVKKKIFCLDEDNIESIYLVISAHQLAEAGVITRDLVIQHSSSVAPCRPAWVGTARLSSTQGGSVASTASAQGVTFELLGEEDTSNFQGFGVVPGGTARMEQFLLDCERFPQPDSVAIATDNTTGSIGVEYSPDGTNVTFTGSASTFYQGSIIGNCETRERVDGFPVSASWLSFGNGITVPRDPASAEQRLLGSFNVSIFPGTNSILTIDLTLVRR